MCGVGNREAVSLGVPTGLRVTCVTVSHKCRPIVGHMVQKLGDHNFHTGMPRPSLSLHSSQGVSLGDTVTLRCHLPQPAAWVELYQDGLLRSYKDMDKHQVMAEFSLVCVKLEDAMKYCRWAWAFSTGPLGTNVTIQCCNQGYGGIIFLHKDGHSAPLQHRDPRGGGTATFTLFGVTPADSGTYRCSYHPKASSLSEGPRSVLSLVLVPRPSLSLHPSQGVSLGDTVTLRCHLPRMAAWVWLYQEGGWTYRYHKEKENNTAEFSFIKTTWEHAGMYRCQYQVLVLFGTTETSDPVELMLTGVGTGDGWRFWTVLTELHPILVLSPHADHRYPSPRISPMIWWARGQNLHVGTRAIGEPSFYTSMGTQPLSMTLAPMDAPIAPSPTLLRPQPLGTA
uniref:Ig-like domain-containing protein n=1 Tax=Gallus gallus TaxID=9031 RepID=A0A8V0WZR4_CHICK